MPCVLVRRVLVTRAVRSIVSFLTLCVRVETLPVATGLVESPSTERSKSISPPPQNKKKGCVYSTSTGTILLYRKLVTHAQ